MKMYMLLVPGNWHNAVSYVNDSGLVEYVVQFNTVGLYVHVLFRMTYDQYVIFHAKGML